MTFDEWFDNIHEETRGFYLDVDMYDVKAAWDYQQKIIDKLEAKLKDLEDEGII